MVERLLKGAESMGESVLLCKRYGAGYEYEALRMLEYAELALRVALGRTRAVNNLEEMGN